MTHSKRDQAYQQRVSPGDWSDAVADCDGPQIIVGGPGTGKTEFLVRRALHLVEERGVPATDILVVGFGRRGTFDLEHRIRSDLSRSIPRLGISTFHSLAARMVETHAADLGWDRRPEILTGPEHVDLVHRLLAQSKRSLWSPAYRDLLGSLTFAREVADFVLRSRERVLSSEELAAVAVDRDDWQGLPEFVALYDAELRSQGRIDYGTLLASAVQLLEASAPADSPAGDAGYVLVDEFQDTTAAEARLLASLTKQHGNLTVAADPYQSIYSFRGADLRNVERFPDRFRGADGNPGRRLVLTTSFRVPHAILDAAVRVTSGDLPGAAGPVTPAPGPGRVDVYRFDQETEEAEWIADEMQRVHLEDGISYARMGVLVRSKRRFIPQLIRALDRRGMPHDRPDARLADRSAVRFMLDLVAAATGVDGPAGTSRAIRRVLLGPMFALPLGSLRRLETVRAEMDEPSWAAAIRAEVPRGGEVADLLDDPSWATARPASEGLWHLWSHLTAVTEIVADPERSDEREAWTSIAQVLRRWNERNPRATLADYRRLSEEEEFEARPLLSYRSPPVDRPTITTLHQSKGLEFDIVFIADAVEGVFPDLRTRDSLLGVRHLLDHIPQSESDYRAFRLQEERRLAYTAMSRATRRVVWTATSTGFEEGRGIPSRFLALVAGTETVAEAVAEPPLREHPVTPRETEGYLRRLLSDPGAPAPRRLAALSVLAERRDERMRDPRVFAGMRKRGRDDGVLPKDVTLSPSQAESYDTCPRRYVLDRWLRVGWATSVYADFGSLIHRVLERVESAAMDEGRKHGGIDRALVALDTEFDPEAFGGPPYADAWYQRGVDALQHLYAHWPSAGRPVGIERDLDLDLAGMKWHGRADRVEAHGAGFAVVDYKTSRTLPTRDEAAGSLQLGYYVLSAMNDPDLAALGPPAGAEMWFPAARGNSVKTRALDLDRLPEVRERLISAAHGIVAEDWMPRPGTHCERCPMRPLCPAWLEGREAFT